MHTTIIHRESTNSKESGHISALGKKKKKTPSKQSGSRKMEIVYQFMTNTNTKDIYIYQGLKKS